MSLTAAPAAIDWRNDPAPLRCPSCGGTPAPRAGGFECPACGAHYPIEDGVLVVQADPTGDAKLARDFYDGPRAPQFQIWKRAYLAAVGGARPALATVLRHLPSRSTLRLLDVAVGDGAYLDWLPDRWDIVGLDISRVQLAACRSRNAARAPRLVLGEAENLPFPDGAFDAVLCLGGFNLFHDPEAALREMVRVVRPGSAIVISDMLPNVTDRLPGRRLGLPGLDRWFVAHVLRLGADFTGLLERHRHLDLIGIGCRNLEYCQLEPIWRGTAYLMAGQAPTSGLRPA